jgi:hypothetical protein
MNLAWGNKVDAEFRAAVLSVCHELGWTDMHASWLMACIAFESAETFSPSIKNFAGSSGTGLIQFMRRTAIGLGTTVEDLAEMTVPQQMIYVGKYFRPYAHRVRSLADMYMAILSPKAIGRSDNFVLYSDGAAYRMNAALDKDNDGRITKIEAAAFVIDKHRKGLRDGYALVLRPSSTVQDIIARIEVDLMLLKTITLRGGI